MSDERDHRRADVSARLAAVTNDSLGPPKKDRQGLKGDDDGGNFDDMEARVARLEAQLDAVGRDITDLKIGQATLVERSQHLATKADLEKTATRVAAIIIALTAVITIAARFIPAAH